MNSLIQTTNAKLDNWYKNAKIDYNVEGNGKSKIENEMFIIEYTENGVTKTWQTPFYPELDNDFYFNVWMEEAQ